MAEAGARGRQGEVFADGSWGHGVPVFVARRAAYKVRSGSNPETGMAGGRWRVAVIVLVAVAAAVAVRFGLDQYQEQALVAEVDEAVDRIRERGVRRHPDLPVSEAMRREALATINERLAAEDDPVKRRVMAAGNFFGLWFMNTRQRPAWCAERGVDITPFVAAFRDNNAEVLAAARAALQDSPVSEDRLYALMAPQLDELVARDMADIAAAHDLGPGEACRAIAASAAAVAGEMHVSRLQPAVYRVLMGDGG